MHRLPVLLFGLALASPALGQTVIDPFAPIGIEAGRFTVFPAVVTTVSVNDGAAGRSVVISPELLFQSNWAQHSAELLFGADFTPDGGLAIATIADLSLRFDLNALWSLEIGASHRIAAEDVRDPALPAGADVAPDVRTMAADIAAGGPIGNFVLRLGAAAERNVHGDVLVGGVLTDQSERDNTVIAATLRLEPATGALLTPFVEATAGRRIFDQTVGSDGFLQAGNFVGARAGVVYDSTPVLSGEIGIGYRWEIPDDPALATNAGVTMDANVVWSPREVISFTLAAQTAFDPDASPLMGGSVSRDVAFGGVLSLRPNVSLGADGAFGIQTFADGTVEQSASADARLTWIPDYWLQLSTSYSRSWLWSPDPARAETTGIFALTARVQR